MTLSSKDKIFNYVNENKENLTELFVDLLGKLIAEPTVNVVESKMADFPYLKERGEETRTANIIKAWADKEGFNYEVFARQPERENVIIHFGNNEGKRLFIPGHMDVVPPGEGWDSDPFELKIDGDTVIARGVADNKGPLAAILVALKILKESGVELKGGLQIAALADEEAMSETGVDYGMEYLLEEGLVKADYSIVPDIGGEMHNIDVAEKGRVVFEVTAIGKQAHGSTPDLGINAINNMAEFLIRLKNYNFNYTPHEILNNCTVNVGEIVGGAASNIVPGTCTTTIGVRIVPGQEPEAIKEELTTLTEGLEADFKIEIKAASYPHDTDPNSMLVHTIQDTTEEICGFRPEPMGMGGGTYAKSLNLHGIEAVGFSTGNGAAMHVANEYASISEHIYFAKVISVIAAKLLS